VDCAYWTDRTAIAPYLKKGTQVYVEGAPEVRTYTKNDGTFGASLTMRVLSVQLLGGGTRNDGGGSYGEPQSASVGSLPVPSNITEPVDDLPF
jgi:single-strand DNA-binding protein